MPYVSRDDHGQITAVSVQRSDQCSELVAPGDANLMEFIVAVGGKPDDRDRVQFVRSDLDFIRVMEDLINVLIDKHIICFTDLPTIAQSKIVQRREIRAAINKNMNLLDDDNALI